MTKEELKQKLQFLSVEQIEKKISIFVTTQDTGLQLFNIKEEDKPDLLKMFIDEIQSKLINDDNYSLEDYSTSLKREDVLHLYDLPNYTDEMNNCRNVLELDNPDNFNSKITPVVIINGMYVVIRGNVGQNIVLYKYILTIDKTYTRSSFLFFGKDDELFERQKETLLRITPSFHMMYVAGEIILTDMKKLESTLHLDAILKRETEQHISRIKGRNLITNDNYLRKACESPNMCKKLRHALTKGKVVLKSISNADIVSFAEKKKNKLKLHVNSSKDRFDLRSKAEAVRFIKLMDDDYLYSELTKEDYDSNNKDSM